VGRKRKDQCKFRGCQKVQYSKGLCPEHYYKEDPLRTTVLLTIEKKRKLLERVGEMVHWLQQADDYGHDLFLCLKKAVDGDMSFTKGEWVTVFEARDFFRNLGPETRAYWERTIEELEISTK